MEKTQKTIQSIEEQVKIIFSKNDKIISSNTEEKINEIINNKIGRQIILSKIINRHKQVIHKPDITDGFIYQQIIETKDNLFINKLLLNLPKGIIKLEESMDIDYQPLQELLINKNFQEADKLTQKFLCRIVEKKTKIQKNWLYFTDIQFIPRDELFKLDLLWKIYSKGKFGFSVQKNIWNKYNQQWEKFWEKINWTETQNGTMKRYPQEFIWTINAPEGHLPLFNQLRGTQTLSYLFKRINW